MRDGKTRVVGMLLAFVLAACGGGQAGSGATATPARGTLLQLPPDLVATIPAAVLLAQLSAYSDQNLLAIGGTPVCDIAVYHLRYETAGATGEATGASAALMVPIGGAANCRGGRPIVLYAHGTMTDRAFNIANLQDPQNAEGLFLAGYFAAQGYIVVAPNYAGYDTSPLPYHPYLVAEQQANDMIDALRAARTALPLASVLVTQDDGRLFVTGYSEGGYVAMATHRAMQAAGMTVTASAPMSGPYALEAFVDAVYFGEVNASGPISMTLVTTAYQRAYGNIYASASDVFESQYAASIDSLLPSLLSRSALYAAGKLPKFALFNSTPPDAALAPLTPPLLPAILAPTFALGFGAGNLVTNGYRLAYTQDALASPDGGWPAITTGLPSTAPGLGFRQALKRNDLRDWSPRAPMLVCGGDEDPTVFWFNAQLMQRYWSVQPVPAAAVTVLDLDSATSVGDPYANLKSLFATAKQVVAANAVLHGATDGGASAIADVYHAALIPPFCFAAARSLFAAH